MKTRKMVLIALFLSIGIVLNIVESAIPTGIPGVKLGLANIVTLLVLYIYSRKDAVLVLLLRIFLVGLLYSGLFSQTFWLSLGGGLLSISVMILLHLSKKFNVVMISVGGAVAHSVGQIIVAIITLSTKELIYYLPIILAISIPAGILTGLIAKRLITYFHAEDSKTDYKLIIVLCSIALLFFGVHLYLNNRTSNEVLIAKVYYQNELLLEIDINNNSIQKINTGVTDVDLDEASAGIYRFYAYNVDYKESYWITVEVSDGKIRIMEETSKRHICSNQGWTNSKFKPLICLPNQFVIQIEDFTLDEYDFIT